MRRLYRPFVANRGHSTHRRPSGSATNLGFPGDRNDAATYLADRGWQPERTGLNQLLADNGLPLQPGDQDAPFGRNYYCTAVLHKAE